MLLSLGFYFSKFYDILILYKMWDYKNGIRIVEYDFPEVRKIVTAGATTKPKSNFLNSFI